MSDLGTRDPVGDHMKKAFWYRIAATVSLLFAVGHTVGFLRFQPPNDEGRRVWSQMQAVNFEVNGHVFSYGGFYRGFGLIISVLVLFQAALLWWLGDLSREDVKGLLTITGILMATETIVMVLLMRFFGAGPTVLSAITVVALLLSMLSGRSNRAEMQKE
jgi:hypothetical protein